MARGWESKSVESQMESARTDQSQQDDQRSEREKFALREQQNLLLSRSYVQHQLESASNERYAQSLRQALEEINQKLSTLQSTSGH